jgi:hypothetical protein
MDSPEMYDAIAKGKEKEVPRSPYAPLRVRKGGSAKPLCAVEGKKLEYTEYCVIAVITDGMIFSEHEFYLSK